MTLLTAPLDPQAENCRRLVETILEAARSAQAATVMVVVVDERRENVLDRMICIRIRFETPAYAAALVQLSGACGAEQPGPAGHPNPTPQTEKL